MLHICAVKIHVAQAYKNMNMTRQRKPILPLVQEICYYISLLASVLSELQLLVESLRELPVKAYLRQLLRGT